MKLLVWDRVGSISIVQEGGIDKSVIGGYADLGQSAAFFDLRDVSLDDVFMRRGQLCERPILGARIDKRSVRADGEDEIRIRGVAAGATLTVRDGISERSVQTDGTTIHLAFADPGLHVVEIEAHPHKPVRFEITAYP